jgi:hypothetical protein
MESHNADLKLLSNAVVGEVGRFLSEIVSATLLMRWLDWISRYRGESSVQLFSVLTESQTLVQTVVDATSEAATAGDVSFAAKRTNPWHALLRVLIARKHSTTPQARRATVDYFLAGLRSMPIFSMCS